MSKASRPQIQKVKMDEGKLRAVRSWLKECLEEGGRLELRIKMLSHNHSRLCSNVFKLIKTYYSNYSKDNDDNNIFCDDIIDTVKDDDTTDSDGDTIYEFTTTDLGDFYSVLDKYSALIDKLRRDIFMKFHELRLYDIKLESILTKNLSEIAK